MFLLCMVVLEKKNSSKVTVQYYLTLYINLPCYRGLGLYFLFGVSRWLTLAVTNSIYTSFLESLNAQLGSPSKRVRVAHGAKLKKNHTM